VGAQVALSLVVLVAAGLFVRSLLRITPIDPGIATQNRLEVQRVNAAVSVADLRTFTQAIEAGMFPTRAAAALLTIFGLLALTLAAAGVYGVSSYAVSQRTHEIGIRIALGGRREDILRLVLGDGLRPVAIGAVLGLVVVNK
jgi:ABC-type antimicrobial peptide transport system permease subunit